MSSMEWVVVDRHTGQVVSRFGKDRSAARGDAFRRNCKAPVEQFYVAHNTVSNKKAHLEAKGQDAKSR